MNTIMASESDIKKAFQSGDDDGDDTLSVSEASTALEKLCGKSVDESTVEAACRKCGVDTKREMDFDEFVSLVRHLEDNGEL
ncbi:hypothetical protein GE09DRAFT_620155 [Coniochaeta sp. 2T2.1]|nr:hypothetical protein GE09DRAFT_620155 [Coniochaeta sp. 2T2.1]